MSCSSLSLLCRNSTSTVLRRSHFSTPHHAPASGTGGGRHGHPLMTKPSLSTTTSIRSRELHSSVGLSAGSLRSSSRPTLATSSSSNKTGSPAVRNFSVGLPAALLLEGHYLATNDAACDSANNDNSRWPTVLLSACATVAAATALVAAFPTERGTGGGNNNGSGPNLNHSLMYAGAPALEEDRQVVKRNETKSRVVPTSGQRKQFYEVSARAIKGGRVTMEDEYFVADGGRFAAVFDGHGGGGVSSFLKHNLYAGLAQRIEEFQEDELHVCSKSRRSLACHVAALRAAFAKAEETVLRDDSLKYQGSTAVAVMVHDCDDGHRTVLSANVGDSRAILSRRGKAVDLTTDHKPNQEREKQRILSMGETIEWDRFAKVHRVRNLSLSRAIGDRYAKPIVSGEVEIKHFPVVDDGDEFILLASDGLWDVMESQDVVSFVHNHIAQEMERNSTMDKEEKERHKVVLRRNMSHFIAREALRRGSGDNICVVMVWLDDV